MTHQKNLSTAAEHNQQKNVSTTAEHSQQKNVSTAAEHSQQKDVSSAAEPSASRRMYLLLLNLRPAEGFNYCCCPIGQQKNLTATAAA